MAASLLQNLLNALGRKPLAGVPALDEAQQRRLVLMAVREAAPDRLPAFRKRLLTLDELNADIRENAWVLILLFWAFFPLVILEDLIPALRVRKAIEEQWRTWIDHPAPDLDRWVLEGEVRRQIKALSWRQRWALRSLARERASFRRSRASWKAGASWRPGTGA